MSDGDQEEWCPVVGWEGLYEVSSLGRVRSLDRRVKTKRGDRLASGRILTGFAQWQGYRMVKLCGSGPDRTVSVHRLVARAFLGDAPTKAHQVAHYDGVKSNNRAGNLRWATSSENAADKARHGTMAQGERIASSRLTNEQARDIKASAAAVEILAGKFGVSETTIRAIRREQNWKHVEEHIAAPPPGRPSGVAHYRAKLSEDDVRAIRRRERSARDDAKLYGVSYDTVIDIRLRRTWKHID